VEDQWWPVSASQSASSGFCDDLRSCFSHPHVTTYTSNFLMQSRRKSFPRAFSIPRSWWNKRVWPMCWPGYGLQRVFQRLSGSLLFNLDKRLWFFLRAFLLSVLSSRWIFSSALFPALCLPTTVQSLHDHPVDHLPAIRSQNTTTA
jgi:hypothetical protein